MKKFLALLICLSILTCLFSCGKSESGESGNTSSEAESVDESSAPESETESANESSDPEPEEEITENSPTQEKVIPYWQMYGEYDDIDFDITDYLDELGEKYGKDGKLFYNMDQSDLKSYTGFVYNTETDKDAMKAFPCFIYIFSDAKKASEWYNENFKVYHPGLFAYSSTIRIGNQYFSGYYGFILDIATYAGIDTAEWVEVRHKVSLKKINLTCNQNEFIPCLKERGYSIYESDWYSEMTMNGETDFKINSYICVAPENGCALLVYLCDPEKTNYLVLHDSNFMKKFMTEYQMLNTCYDFSEKGIVIIGAKPYIDCLVKDIK